MLVYTVANVLNLDQLTTNDYSVKVEETMKI